jgi:hypothetical protein
LGHAPTTTDESIVGGAHAPSSPIHPARGVKEVGMLQLIEGDIVFARIKFSESEQTKVRPVLVLDITPFGVRVAYGSSQHVGSPLQWEFDVPSHLASAVHLPRATRFDLRCRQVLTPDLGNTAIWVHKGPIGNIEALREIGAEILRAYRHSGLV